MRTLVLVDKRLELANTTIAVAEDDPDVLEVIALFLRPAGATVVEAMDGEEFLKTIERVDTCPLDAAVIDLQMPGISGLDAITELRARGYQGLSVAMSGDPSRKYQSLELGAAAFIRTPFILDQLADRLNSGLP